MKFSIVTISFNQQKYIKQCIDSVISQNYNNYEYIMVDPGSTDGSRSIIESYGDKLIKIFKEDCGPADGLNNGFSIAKGEIFYFINADDFLLPETLKRVANIFENNPNYDLILGGGYLVDQNSKIKKVIFPSKVSTQMYVNGAVTFFQQGMFFRRELFSKFNFNIDNKTCWDGELLLNFLMNNYRVYRCMEMFGAFRIYPESITGSQRLRESYKADAKRLYLQVYSKESKFENRIIKKLYFRLLKLIVDPKYFFLKLIKYK